MGAYTIKMRLLSFGGIHFICSWKNVKRANIRYVRCKDEFKVTVPLSHTEEEALAWIASNEAWIKKVSEKAEPEEEITRAQREAFMRLTAERFRHWQQEMDLKVKRVTVRLMTSRWGSCSPSRGNISINLRLATHPQTHIDYVIVHELAHLVHPNHSRAFWDLVEKHIPDYLAIRRRMR